MKLRALLLGSAAGAALLVPSAAMAATKTVVMGPPTPKASATLQNQNADINDFFPHGVTIHAGDKVKFVVNGFHTVDFPPKGGAVAPLLTPGDPVTGANDAAGQPFWFNGQPALGFNPILFASGFGKSFTRTGATRVESGLPLADQPPPMTVKFPKKGSFTYFCDVHAGMKGVVHVVAKTAKAPSKRADAKTVAAQLNRDLTILKKVDQYKSGSGSVQIGGAGAHGVESYNFFPAATSVKVGTTLTFRMPVNSTEDHTASTGPGDPNNPADANSYLGQLSASFQGPAPAPTAVYSSEKPGGTPASLTPALHGNGFWNSGVLDSGANTPLPASNQVTFGAPGTYTFHCLIHPFMKATVTVTQ